MIQPGEIDQVSEKLGIHTSHVQRDYVHGWLLSLLFTSSPLGKLLTLKGGNCLRKGYFESGRYSRDLDFTTSSSIPDSDLGRELNAICKIMGERTGIVFDTERTRVEPSAALTMRNGYRKRGCTFVTFMVRRTRSRSGYGLT